MARAGRHAHSRLQIDAWQLEESLRIEQQAQAKKEPLYAARSNLLGRIDCFWQTALAHSPIRTQITASDQELLSSLDTVCTRTTLCKRIPA